LRRTLGLDEREPTAACTDAKQHGSDDSARCASDRIRQGRGAGCGRTRLVPALAADAC